MRARGALGSGGGGTGDAPPMNGLLERELRQQNLPSAVVGHVLGAEGGLPKIYVELEISFFLLKRLLGVRTEDGKKSARVQKLAKNEVLMVNIGSLSTGGRVMAVKADLAKIALTQPVCTDVGEKIALSRRIDKHWRLIGWGSITKGKGISKV